jgi:DNA-binding transcriptional ArsR family regulator
MSVDRVLAALADPTRQQLLEALSRRPGCSATTLAAHVPVSRQAVAKHLAVLRESRLVTSHRAGKEVLFAVCPAELEAAASWMTTLAATWEERLSLLKQQAEQGQPEQGQPEQGQPEHTRPSRTQSRERN